MVACACEAGCGPAVAVRIIFAEIHSMKSLSTPTHSEQQRPLLASCVRLSPVVWSFKKGCTCCATWSVCSAAVCGPVQAQLRLHCAEQAQADVVRGHRPCGWLGRCSHANSAGKGRLQYPLCTPLPDARACRFTVPLASSHWIHPAIFTAVSPQVAYVCV
mgnify:CR=1 FL=1